MPFKSDRQRKWMFVNEPEMAKHWSKHEGEMNEMPKQPTYSRFPEAHPPRDANLPKMSNVVKSKKNVSLTDEEIEAIEYSIMGTIESHPEAEEHRKALDSVLSKLKK